MWCAAETVAKACERTGFEIHSHVGNAPMEQLSGVCAVPAYRPPDGHGKKGLKEQDDDMFGPLISFRYSGTQALCRVMVEGPEQAMVDRITDRLVQVVTAALC
jgi:phosphomannomutase